MAEAPDRWHRWLTDVRFGGDPVDREHMLTKVLYPVRETVLGKAKLQPGDTVLDVGTGDGLIAFGALERLGPSGRVVFSDISQDLLDHCREAATAEGCWTGAGSCWHRPIRWRASRTPRSMPSPHDLSDLRERQGGGAAGVLPRAAARRAYQRVRAGGVRRIGPLQSGLSQLEWLSYRCGGHGLLPNLSWVVAVPDGLPDDAVADAVHTLLLRHEVLRTAFDADQDGRPQQSVDEDVLVVLPHVEDEDSQRLSIEATFDIATEPPIRFGRTSDGDLVFAAAHIATDGLGAGVLVADLTELLAAQEERRPARLSRTCRSRSTGPATSRRAAGPGSSQPCGTGTPPCATSR